MRYTWAIRLNTRRRRWTILEKATAAEPERRWEMDTRRCRFRQPFYLWPESIARTILGR